MKEGTDLWSVPSFVSFKADPRQSLLQRCVGRACGRRGVVTDHARLVGVEAALTGRATICRVSNDLVTVRRKISVSCEGEAITALRARSKNAVNQDRKS